MVSINLLPSAAFCIGSSVSLTSIGNTLANEDLPDSNRKTAPAVQAYVNALLEAYVFYGAKRYDISFLPYFQNAAHIPITVITIPTARYLASMRPSAITVELSV